MKDKYKIEFKKNGIIVTEVFPEDIIEVILSSNEENKDDQSREISNFRYDMSNIEILNAKYIENTLTNAVDEPPNGENDPNFKSVVEVGLLKTHKMNANGIRISLTTKIKFKIKILNGKQVTLTCLKDKFYINGIINQKKEFILKIKNNSEEKEIEEPKRNTIIFFTILPFLIISFLLIQKFNIKEKMVSYWKKINKKNLTI